MSAGEEAFSGRSRLDESADDLCLITGATGFIGGHLTERLLQEDRRVRCLVRPTSERALLKRLNVDLVEGDLAMPRSLARAAEGCRYVLHCGALVSDWATVE